MSETTRRGVLAGAAGVGAAAVLAACGTSTDGSDTSTGDTDNGASPGGGPSTGGPSTGGSNSGGSTIGQTSEIPVGGGKIFGEKGVVVTQPAAGTFKAFSARCTHEGCTVGTVVNGTINCLCHHSSFSVADGSVKAGPARSPLPAKNVTVQGTDIVVA